MNPATRANLLASIASRRLVVILGAGLSLPAPSNLPTARQLAEDSANEHYIRTNERLDAATSTNLDALAALFFGRGKLESYFIGTLVRWQPFVGVPNRGHLAVADFILCGVCDFAVTTNVDWLVEIAASRLGEPDLQSAVDGLEAATPRSHRQYLKIHGCCKRKREQTLWCESQLTTGGWPARIATSQQWLGARLMQRDIVFVGYWTDWDYLNAVLVGCLGGEVPMSVTIVDPAGDDELKAKAPSLWAWAHRPGIVFSHEQMSGVDFLDEVRHAFSQVVLGQISEVGRQALVNEGTSLAPLPSLESISVDDLYDLRRDWTGVSRAQPVTRCEASPQDETLGRFLFRLLNKGGLLQGSFIKLGPHLLRLLHAGGRQIQTIMRGFSGEALPSGGPDITICVGAYGSSLVPAHIIRGSTPSTVMRPSTMGRWITQAEAEAELELSI